MLLAWGYAISKLLLKFLINFVLSSAQQLDASILALAALARFCSPSFMFTGTLRVLHPLMDLCLVLPGFGGASQVRRSRESRGL